MMLFCLEQEIKLAPSGERKEKDPHISSFPSYTAAQGTDLVVQ